MNISTATFHQKAPAIMAWLMRDFDLSTDDAAAIVGNLGHESGGFRFLQEKKPLVPGSRGGWGWAQWTGPRRRAFERWVAGKGLDPSSDDANYGFLVVELQGAEKAAIPAVRAAGTLFEKVKAFELAFERASPKHKGYASRNKWAQLALDAYHGRIDAVAERAIDQISPSRNKTAPAKARRWAEEDLEAFEIEAIQKRLRELLFFTVGKVDGRWEGATSAAITQLQRDRHDLYKRQLNHPLAPSREIEVDGHWGPQTKAELAKDIKRHIPASRRNTTAQDLRNQGSSTIRNNDAVKQPSKWGGLGLQLASIMGAVSEFAGQAVDAISPITSFFEGIPMWLVLLVFAGVLYYFWHRSQKVEDSRVMAERLGMHNGEPEPAPTPDQDDEDEEQAAFPLAEAA